MLATATPGHVASLRCRRLPEVERRHLRVRRLIVADDLYRCAEPRRELTTIEYTEICRIEDLYGPDDAAYHLARLLRPLRVCTCTGCIDTRHRHGS